MVRFPHVRHLAIRLLEDEGLVFTIPGGDLRQAAGRQRSPAEDDVAKADTVAFAGDPQQLAIGNCYPGEPPGP